METIFRALINAINKISVLFGGDEIAINETVVADIKAWFSNIGIDFVD